MTTNRRTTCAGLVLALLPALSGCGGGAGSVAGPGEGSAPTLLHVAPVEGEHVGTDTPEFTVQNARGYDVGQAEYTFEVITPGALRVVASATVAAAAPQTKATLGPLPRGVALAWRVTARNVNGRQITSNATRFSLPPVECGPLRNPYAKSVVDWFLTACSLATNRYNDPRDVLGPPDAGGSRDAFHGFMSLGEGGYVIVDMEGCAVDGPGFDVRVFQTVTSEPVTLYAGGSPTGPWELVEARKRCGDRLPGLRSGYCDFDFAPVEIREARYLKVEDGELFPCERAGTDSEGADIDAIQILNGGP